MVDIKTTGLGPGTSQERAPEHMRNKRRHRRLQILKDARAEHGGIRVVPTDEKLRGVLKHPNGTKFRSKGSIEWPNDRFTQRRLRDGSVKIEAKKQEAKAEAPATAPARSRSQAPSTSA